MADLRRVAAEGQLPWAHRLQRTAVVDRSSTLAEICRGQRVAHVGFADAGCEKTHQQDEGWLHSVLSNTAASLVGLDISRDAVAAAQNEGYEAYAVDCTRVADVAALGLGTFDVVVAGEVLEHLEAPGPFLENMLLLTGDTGRLILTTPNAYRPQNVLLAMTQREWVHPDHVLTFSARTLMVLLERSGWRVEQLSTYLNPAEPSRGFVSPGVAAVRATTLAQRLLARRVSPYVADGFLVVASPNAVTEEVG